MSAQFLPVERVRTLSRRLAAAATATVSPFTGTAQAQDWGGRWWEYDLQFADMEQHDGRRLAAFFNSLGGPSRPFLFRDPSLCRDATGLGSPVVSGAGQSGASLVTAGWQAVGARNELSNSAMQGAVVGTLGAGGALPTTWFTTNIPAAAVQVEAVGLDGAEHFLRVRLNGPPTGANVSLAFVNNATAPAAAVGQVWSSTFRGQIVAGSRTNITAIRQRIASLDAGQLFLTAQTAGPADIGAMSTLARVGGAVTLSSSATAFITTSLEIVTAGAIDVTFIIRAPQLERGAAFTGYEQTPQVVMRAGDCFSLGTGAATRLYEVSADTACSPTGAATLPIQPPLRSAPGNAGPLEIARPAVLLRLTDAPPSSIRPARIYSFSTTAREAI